MSMEKLLNNLDNELRCLGRRETGRELFLSAAKKAVLVMFTAWLLWSLLFDMVLEGIVFSVACSASCIYFLVTGPRRELEARARKIEKFLPFALMQVGVELNVGIPFEKALKRIGTRNYGELSRELDKELGAKKCGGSITASLLEFAGNNKSNLVKRAVSQLISAYEYGGAAPGESLRKMASEMLARQKAQAKEFSAKTAVFSVAFVVLSAVAPSLFQAYVVVGSTFMEMPFSPMHVLLITTLLFPLLNIAMLLYIKSMAPEFLKG